MWYFVYGAYRKKIYFIGLMNDKTSDIFNDLLTELNTIVKSTFSVSLCVAAFSHGYASSFIATATSHAGYSHK